MFSIAFGLGAPIGGGAGTVTRTYVGVVSMTPEPDPQLAQAKAITLKLEAFPTLELESQDVTLSEEPTLTPATAPTLKGCP